MFLTAFRKTFWAGLIAGAALLLGFGFICSGAGAQVTASASGSDQDRARIEVVLNGLNRGRQIGQVAIAPDGKRLAWIEQDDGGMEIRVAPLGDLKKSERVTAAAKPEQHCREGEIDLVAGRAGAGFLFRLREGGRAGRPLSFAAGRQPARRLTELKGYVEAPAFSPDGSVWHFYMWRAQRGRLGRWRR